MMYWPSVTTIAIGLFVAYLTHSGWTMYNLFYPPPCPPNRPCIKPFLSKEPDTKLQLMIYTTQQYFPRNREPRSDKLKLLWEKPDFRIQQKFEETVHVSIPKKVRENGTLYVHVFTTPVGESPFANSWTSHASSQMTTYAEPQAKTLNLMADGSDDDQDIKQEKAVRNEKFTHFRSKLAINVVDEIISFDRRNIPGDVFRYIRTSPEGDYLPILFIDELSNRVRDLKPVNDTSKKLELTISYNPISIGHLRLWTNMLEAVNMLQGLGFTEKDTDEVKGIFSDTNFYFLMMTFFVAACHLLFDFLAFKNDISYWKARKTMVGLSTKAVLWRCISTFIIFLYLLDEKTSMLVLIPAGIGMFIEIWKVTKAFKVKVSWQGYHPSFKLGTVSQKEKETQEMDSEAMKYLSYALYPLCIGGAVYSLIYTPHKSWYSWCIQSLVNGVYAFGFLFMLPQLFVNYKLKSVAHLPWKAFMYKAFNTFIDDIFAFIITMPTAHRLACFRDDVVFVLYLYQRWLYPVDKARVNEFGQSFDNDGDVLVNTAQPIEDKKTK